MIMRIYGDNQRTIIRKDNKDSKVYLQLVYEYIHKYLHGDNILN